MFKFLSFVFGFFCFVCLVVVVVVDENKMRIYVPGEETCSSTILQIQRYFVVVVVVVVTIVVVSQMIFSLLYPYSKHFLFNLFP